MDIYREKPNCSWRVIVSDRWAENSLAVVEASTVSACREPFMRVTLTSSIVFCVAACKNGLKDSRSLGYFLNV